MPDGFGGRTEVLQHSDRLELGVLRASVWHSSENERLHVVVHEARRCGLTFVVVWVC